MLTELPDTPFLSANEAVPVGIKSLEYGLYFDTTLNENADINEVTMAIDADAVVLGDLDFEILILLKLFEGKVGDIFRFRHNKHTGYINPALLSQNV